MTFRLVGILLLFLACCQYSENRYARHTVLPAQLTGTWHATDFSLKCVAKLPNEGRLTRAENEIVLKPDGSCSARGYLNPMADPPPRFGSTNKYETFGPGCTWTLRSGRHQELLISDGGKHAVSFYFDDSEGKLILWQYVTDPDAWQYVEFERR